MEVSGGGRQSGPRQIEPSSAAVLSLLKSLSDLGIRSPVVVTIESHGFEGIAGRFDMRAKHGYPSVPLTRRSPNLPPEKPRRTRRSIVWRTYKWPSKGDVLGFRTASLERSNHRSRLHPCVLAHTN
jgi:hypothetical protein